MKFVCAGKNKVLFERLYSEIFEIGDSFYYYEDGLELLNDLSSQRISPDLVLLEQKLYKSFLPLFYEVLKSKEVKIPLILLGVHTPNGENQVPLWISENEFQYDIQTMHTMIPILKKIDEKSAILWKKADSLEKSSFKESISEDFIENFSRKNSLTPAISSLLSFFCENKFRDVSLEEIEEKVTLLSNTDLSRKNVAYANISRLRKNLNKIPKCPLDLIRTKKGCYRLIIHWCEN